MGLGICINKVIISIKAWFFGFREEGFLVFWSLSLGLICDYSIRSFQWVVLLRAWLYWNDDNVSISSGLGNASCGCIEVASGLENSQRICVRFVFFNIGRADFEEEIKFKWGTIVTPDCRLCFSHTSIGGYKAEGKELILKKLKTDNLGFCTEGTRVPNPQADRFYYGIGDYLKHINSKGFPVSTSINPRTSIERNHSFFWVLWTCPLSLNQFLCLFGCFGEIWRSRMFPLVQKKRWFQV